MFENALSDPTKQLCLKLTGTTLPHQFYLAGGSGAALHLGHRISVALDFFTADQFATDAVLQQLHSIGPFEVQQSGPGTVLGICQNVRISFFTYSYPLLETTSTWKGIRIASLLDIALMKVIAISQRGKKRDFVDLYGICTEGIELEALLRRVPEKYTNLKYPEYHLLRALNYFDDADRETAPLTMVQPVEWNTVKKFFQEQVKQIFSGLT